MRLINSIPINKLSELQHIPCISNITIVYIIIFLHLEKIYIVLEYAREGDIYQHLRRLKRFDDQTTATLVSQLATALMYTHSHNVLHRDIKPENILLGTEPGECFKWFIIIWYLPSEFRSVIAATSFAGN